MNKLNNKNIIFNSKDKDSQAQTITMSDHLLGAGAFGQVKYGFDAKDPKKVYAIKVIDKNKL